MNVLLSGIVGSKAYGLDNEDSDTDRLGIFVATTNQLLSLNPPKDTLVTTKPDYTFHEVLKYIRLALNVNPTVTELMWLESYESATGLGRQLVSIRQSFLSKDRVKDAYLGYAFAQFKRLEARSDGSFSSDTRKRTAKHARHLARLLYQGKHLYEFGVLPVRLWNPQWYMEFGERVSQGDLNIAEDLISATEIAIAKAKSPIPDEPDKSKIEEWLQKVRRHYYY